MKTEEEIKERLDDLRQASRKANSTLVDMCLKDIKDELLWVLGD